MRRRDGDGGGGEVWFESNAQAATGALYETCASATVRASGKERVGSVFATRNNQAQFLPLDLEEFL